MSTPTDTFTDAMVAFGQVVTVRPVPTRGVTQIVIEIPDDHHVAATSMLFGKNAFIFSADHGSTGKFGVGPLSELKGSQPATADQSSRPAQTRIGGGLHIDTNPSRWLGIHCQSAEFMGWLGVGDATEAIQKVRELCGVSSRSEIAGNTRAMQDFLAKIYRPYNRYKAENTPSS